METNYTPADGRVVVTHGVSLYSGAIPRTLATVGFRPFDVCGGA